MSAPNLIEYKDDGVYINGVQVAVKKARSSENNKYVYDSSLKLIVGGSAQGTDHANTGTNWGTTQSVVTYGSVSDLWGCSLTPAIVNTSTFGVYFRTHIHANLRVSPTALVNYISVTVTYTVASVVESQQVIFI